MCPLARGEDVRAPIVIIKLLGASCLMRELAGGGQGKAIRHQEAWNNLDGAPPACHCIPEARIPATE